MINIFTSRAGSVTEWGMEIFGPISGGGAGTARSPAFSLGQNMSIVVTQVSTIQEARSLPCGSIVGDIHGGLTFNDAVASALEARSLHGWQEHEPAPGDHWTIIILDR